MLILLTNDDGIYAEGLNVLYRFMKEIGEAYVVAPDRERSATGHGITMHKPLRVNEVSLTDGNDKAFSVNGTPTDCIKLALEALLPRDPDIIISGINFGSNVGTDVLYSGTVSAAIEGTIAGIKSTAVSLDVQCNNPDFVPASKFIQNFTKIYNEKSIPSDTLLNINIPDLPKEKIEGIEITKIGRRKYKDSIEQRKDPRGKTYFWLAGEISDSDSGYDTDSSALKRNMISICPMHLDLTKYEIINQIRDWDINI